jgi:hypothetical protein
MTDNEIIEALQRCKYHKECCYCNSVEECGNKRKLTTSALDLINRLQAENKQLKSDISVSRDAYLSMKDRYEYEKEKVEKAKQKCIDIAKALKTAKAEAIKEFAAKIKEDAEWICDDNYIEDELTEYVDNLVKEMVGCEYVD